MILSTVPAYSSSFGLFFIESSGSSSVFISTVTATGVAIVVVIPG